MTENSMDFELKDHTGTTHTRDGLRGKRVLLSFHPLAWTKVCADHMLSLEANYEALAKRDTVALGVSVDSVPCKKAWAKSLGIEQTPLLCDFWPHGELAQSLELFLAEGGTSERANVILNQDSEIIFKKIYPMSEVPDMGEILAFLDEEPERR